MTNTEWKETIEKAIEDDCAEISAMRAKPYTFGWGETMQSEPRPKIEPYQPGKMTKEEIEAALQRMAPKVLDTAPPVSPREPRPIPGGFTAMPTEQFKKLSPTAQSPRSQWPLTNWMLDASVATFIATFLGAYGALIYMVALFGLPKIFLWAQSL